MSIGAILGSEGSFPMGDMNSLSKMKQNFDNLGSALSSGNLEDAQKAFAELQKNAPGGNGRNPMSAEIERLGSALESGDLEGAQNAFNNMQAKMAQRSMPSGPPPGGANAAGGGSDTVNLSAAGKSKSESASYDKKDINKDGTVSLEEEMQYMIEEQLKASSESSGSKNGQVQSGIDTYA